MTSYQSNKKPDYVPIRRKAVPFIPICSITTRLFEDSEDVDEQIDNVQVELNGSNDVFFGGDFVHDHLRVEDNEETEHSHATEAQHNFISARIEHKLKTTNTSFADKQTVKCPARKEDLRTKDQ